jgi:lipopolysaccharide/colanic/teichoic acid biosynthesis glycosyltransferase
VIKRVVDIVGAVVGLLLASPVLLVAAVLIKVDSPGPVLFCQERIGRGFIPFVIYKLRTMAVGRDEGKSALTRDKDSRVTRIGGWLRATKIDELPQLVNVLLGDMSVVGPRPEVPRYVDMFRQDYAELLTIRPGMTDLASLKYRNEEVLLARAEDPEVEYVSRILPDKIHLAKSYLRQSSLLFDLLLVIRTLFSLIRPAQR